VRFLRNFTGREELQIRNRGARAEIFIPEGEKLTSGFTGNLADICPVGALTTREFRFKARPWEMKTTNSICGECSLNCSSQIWRKELHVLRMTPRVEPKVNEWWLCDKGRFSVNQHLTSDRLTVAYKAGENPSNQTPEQVVEYLLAAMKKVPEGDMAFVADPTLTNEEFHTLKLLGKVAGNGQVFVSATREALELNKLLKSTGLSEGFPEKLEGAKSAYILGENVEQDHPVLMLRLRRLHFTQGLQIIPVGLQSSSFKDISTENIVIKDEQEICNYFQKLQNTENAYFFINDSWITPKTYSEVKKWVQGVAAAKKNVSVSLLFTGANIGGQIDQWDSNVKSRTELETEIQRGKVQGILWFGKALSTPIFDEYVRGMRIFAQAVLRAKDAHPKVHWLLPLDTFYEKKGTYTNTFGRVQTIRRSTRVVTKGFEPQSLMNLLLSKLTKQPATDIDQIYEDLAKEIPFYPKRVVEISESEKTYKHYERALWQ